MILASIPEEIVEAIPLFKDASIPPSTKTERPLFKELIKPPSTEVVKPAVKWASNPAFKPKDKPASILVSNPLLILVAIPLDIDNFIPASIPTSNPLFKAIRKPALLLISLEASRPIISAISLMSVTASPFMSPAARKERSLKESKLIKAPDFIERSLPDIISTFLPASIEISIPALFFKTPSAIDVILGAVIRISSSLCNISSPLELISVMPSTFKRQSPTTLISKIPLYS